MKSLEDGVNNYNIQRLHIEQLILSCFINQNRTLPMDEMEFKDIKIPFELFRANRTTKMIAKAIYNLQEEDKPVDDVNVITYIQKHTTLNEQEFLEINCMTWVGFDTMNLYLKQLKDLDDEEKKNEILRVLV